MTNKETVERNIGLTFDFLRQIVKEPSILENMPDKAVIEFVDKDVSIIEKSHTKNNQKKYIRVKKQFEAI